MMMTPTSDRVIVRLDEPERVTPGGLHLAPIAEKKPSSGTVVAVGPGRPTEHGRVRPDVEPGDVVLFGSYRGTEFDWPDDHRYLVLTPAEVLAVVEGDGS